MEFIISLLLCIAAVVLMGGAVIGGVALVQKGSPVVGYILAALGSAAMLGCVYVTVYSLFIPSL